MDTVHFSLTKLTFVNTIVSYTAFLVHGGDLLVRDPRSGIVISVWVGDYRCVYLYPTLK